MAGGRLNLSEALDIAAQIAAALTAAHAAGIVHRDVKPENIMLRKDGYAKLLDFGLAKPTERQSSSVDTEAQTKMLVNTSPGMVMGTVSYMSPEQARGFMLDARTDIWSLGCVLYEMAAGRVPFAGETTSDVIVAVLDREPPPLPGGAHEAPLELQRILRKGLRKDKEERYQTIKDLLVDLKALKQEVDFELKLETSVPPESRSLAAFSTISAQNSLETERERATHTTYAPLTHTTLGVEQAGHPVKPNEKLKQVAVLALVFAFAAGVTLLLYSYLHQKAKWTPFSFQSMKLTRLTATGKSTQAAISPDGKIVAYVVNEAGQRSLWIRQVATSRNLQIVEPSDVDYFGVTVTPDANLVYYVTSKQNDPYRELYQISVLGGTPKKIMTDVDSPVTFSPDGKRLAFTRGEPDKGQVSLMIANADGTGEKRIAARKSPASYENPAWSPDGTIIACAAADGIAGKVMTAVAVNPDNGAEKPLTAEKWLGVGQLSWLADGSGLVIVAADQESRLSQLWHVSYPDGATKRLTNDLNNYGGVSIAGQSDNLVTVRFDQSSNVWVAQQNANASQSGAPNPKGFAIDVSQARQITSGVKYYSCAWTPDSKLVCSADASGTRDLWIMDSDGSHQKQLTSDAGSNFQPAVSPDGRYIVFISDRDGKQNIWRIDADGSHPTQLTNTEFSRNPSVTPDGKWVVLVALGSKQNPTLWKVPIEGGTPVQINDKWSAAPTVAPDGKFIACYYWDEKPDSQLGIAVIPSDGGAPVKIFNLPSMFVRWSPDGRGLVYIDNRSGVSNLWMQPLDEGKPVPLTNFQTDQIFAFDWSPDGKQLTLARGTVTSDVVLFSELK